ncbi:MAG: type II toxin-antitoxin system VapC family toxin [Methylobacterium mesophilicum]|nr:type II toxin-antitoxin system VapC family toxin [Methylobacterium mesophilicum]
MRLLLDTHLLLWAAGAPDKLSADAVALLSDRRSQLLFSAASLWEIAIKSGLGRDDFQIDLRRLRRGLIGAGYTEVPITAEHAEALLTLPPLHKDPFDRILVAQSMVESLILLTVDEMVARYPGSVRRV